MTIFEESGEYKQSKAWGKKDWFPLLKDKKKISDKLKELGIQKVICFDMLGENWEDWKVEKDLTLAIMPLCNVVDQDGKETISALKKYGFALKEKYLPVDIVTSEIYKIEDFVAYFPTRNLLVALVNPFLDEDMFGMICSNITDLEPEFLSEEKIWELKLQEVWKVRMGRTIADKKNLLDNEKRRIVDYRTSYLKSIERSKIVNEELNVLEKYQDNISSKIKKELQDIKKLPIVKKISIGDKIYVEFGDVYVTGGVVVKYDEDEEGCKQPIVEPRKVFIGKLKFIIGDEDIIIENPNKIGRYEHPHAADGRICFGEGDIQSRKLLQEVEIAKLINFLYSWAFSYNESDAYCKLQTFYDARQREKKSD